ncbi:hypothetical protein CPAV1605_1571 [seawater metagenome]|uniref:Uncharacterized protein n=1 Tax=seawater metagenome TaxID=1561972 RepID=A0A5E8CLH6_9ZZZZ
MITDKYLISEICSYLYITDIVKFYKIFRAEFLENLILKYKVLRSLRYHTLFSYFDKTTFNKKIIYSLPYLEYKSSFSLGDYIDNIKNKDLSHPIMIGLDYWNRPFITFKVLNKYQKGSAITFFQRYSNDTKNWTTGGLRGPPPDFIELNDISRMTQLSKKTFRYILKNAIL